MRRAAIAVAAWVLFLGGPGQAHAQVRDLHRSWHTVRSSNFEVSYPEPLGPMAQRTLAVLERARSRIEPIMGHAPRGRVQVVLTDQSEGANGSATPLDYNTIRLFASSPEDLSILGDYDDWLTTLVNHEHTHILHLDNIGGLPKVINAVFGKTYAPNFVLPRWLIEGIATYVESRTTSGGRMRSTQFEMFLRAAVLEDAALRIDQLSNVVDQWPRGNTYYLYGSRFVQFIVDRYGEDVLSEMSTWYGRRALPFGVNRMAKRATGKTFTALYDEWLASLRVKYTDVANEVMEQGLVRGERLTFHGEFVRGLRFSGARKLLYYVSDGRSEGQLRTLNLDAPRKPWRTPRRGLSGRVVTHKRKPRPGSAARIGKSQRRQRSAELVRAAGTSHPATDPQGNVYYESLDGYDSLYFFYDLFRYDPKSRKRTRLTKGMRARYPDVSPDGTQIAFVRQDAGTSHLYVADVDDVERSMKRVVQSGALEQVYTPRYSPDGARLAYSVWREGGYRDIEVQTLATGQTIRVTHDRAVDTGPVWSPDGTRLYFASDRTGISNVYAWDVRTHETVQVTNVINGAYHPAISPDGKTLAYIGYTHRGYDLFALALDAHDERPARAYKNNRPPPVDTKARIGAEPHKYRPYRTLYPRKYELDFNEDGFGRQIGVSVDGEDAARFHTFSSRLGVSLKKGYVNADFRYSLRRLPAPITLRLFRRVAPRGGLVVNDTRRSFVEDAVGGTAAVSYSIFRSFHTNTVSASYNVTHTRNKEPFGGVLDPNSSPPTIPNLGVSTSLRLSWSYSDVQRHAFDIAPSEGRSLSVALSLSDPVLGTNFRSVRMSWAWRRFIEMPWAEHHVVAFRYGGGMSQDSRGAVRAFSLGGYPDTSFVDQLLSNGLTSGVALRGYAPFSRGGSQFHLLQSEYRFPIARVQAGPQTTPVYMRRLWGTVFVDVGDAYFGRFDPSTLRVGIGAELFLDFVVGWDLSYILRLGIAHGLNTPAGGTRLYAHFGIPF